MFSRLRINSIRGKYRTETLSGREYLVVHATLIVPGVLDGSAGAFLYEAKDIRRSVNGWNGMPIVNGHPYNGRKPISARNPTVLNETGLGFVFNAHLGKNDRLRAELWFDLEKTNQVLPNLITSIRNGEKVEISTGLNAQKEIPPRGKAIHNGKEYTGIARNYKPDHLAVLISGRGACSIKDGCGINNKDAKNNTSTGETSMKLTPKRKKQYVDYIVNNCDCWKGPKDRELLNSMPDAKLVQLKKGIDKNKETNETATLVNSLRTELGIPDDAEFNAETIRATLGKGKKSKVSIANSAVDEDEEEDDEEEEETQRRPAKGKKVNNSKGGLVTEAPKKTAQEWLADAPEEIQEVFNSTRAVYQKSRKEIIEKLVANERNKDKRKAKIEKLSKKKLSELQDLLDLMPEPVTNSKRKDSSDWEDFLGGDTDFRGAGSLPAKRINNREDEFEADEFEDEEEDEEVTNERFILPILTNEFDDSPDDDDETVVKRRKKQSA